MRADRVHLGRDFLLGTAPIIPARDHIEPVARHDGLEHTRVARTLAAELGPVIARLLRLLETGLERRITAEFRHIVIRPGDGIDADADFHARSSCVSSRKREKGGREREAMRNLARPQRRSMSRAASSALLRKDLPCATPSAKPFSSSMKASA